LFQETFADDADENATYHTLKYPQIENMKYHEIGDWSYVILHIVTELYDANASVARNVTHWKSVYFPKVDSFTELRSKYTQSLLSLPNVNVRVWLEFPTFSLRSESRVMLYKYPGASKETEKEYLVGSRAITVVLEEGIMKEAYWDDSCSGCSDELCLEDSCSSVISEIRPECLDVKSLEEDPYRCGIKIYVAWTGTDHNNKTLQSYTSVPSRFQKYSFIFSAYDAAAGFSSDFISFWKKPLN